MKDGSRLFPSPPLRTVRHPERARFHQRAEGSPWITPALAWVPHFWPLLPEVGGLGQNSAGESKLHGGDCCRNISHFRFGHQQMNMLWHDDESDDREAVSVSHLLDDLQQEIASVASSK